MPVKAIAAEDADMDRVFEIACDAFARNEPIWDVLWPNHWTEAGRRIGGERMRLTKNSVPNTTYLKAVDDATGEIIGMAKWNVFNGVAPDPSKDLGSSGNYWDTPEDAEYAKKLIPIFLEKRNEAIARTGHKVVSLDILTVDPSHQRKGVGDALVKWGTDKADELGVEAVVESSVFGRRLYEKNGFVFQENCVVQVPGEKTRPPGEFAWLVRPAKA